MVSPAKAAIVGSDGAGSVANSGTESEGAKDKLDSGESSHKRYQPNVGS